MKQWLTIFFGAITLNAFSQKATVDFTTIDYRVQFVKTTSPAQLAK
jgi:hypothetical protein